MRFIQQELFCFKFMNVKEKRWTKKNSHHLWAFHTVGFGPAPFGGTWNVATALQLLSFKPSGESLNILRDALWKNIIVGTKADFRAAAS